MTDSLKEALAEATRGLYRIAALLQVAGLRAEALALEPEIATLREYAGAWGMRLAQDHLHGSWLADCTRAGEATDPDTTAAFDEMNQESTEKPERWPAYLWRVDAEEAALDTTNEDAERWAPGQPPDRRRAFVEAAAGTCNGHRGLLESLAELFINVLGYDPEVVELGIGDALRAVAA